MGRRFGVPSANPKPVWSENDGIFKKCGINQNEDGDERIFALRQKVRGCHIK